jgi:protein involved in polysaccharide export with SLBB domain
MKKPISLFLMILFIISSFGFGRSAFADEYRLAPNDILEIKITNQKNLDTKQAIAPDGSISLPLLGHVGASGQTLTEFNAYLTSEFSKYLQNPQIVVYLTPRPIYVIQHNQEKNTWEVKDAKTIEEARAYAGKDYKGDIHYGDVINVNTSESPNWVADNWYRIITGTAVVVGIYATLHK